MRNGPVGPDQDARLRRQQVAPGPHGRDGVRARRDLVRPRSDCQRQIEDYRHQHHLRAARRGDHRGKIRGVACPGAVINADGDALDSCRPVRGVDLRSVGRGRRDPRLKFERRLGELSSSEVGDPPEGNRGL